MQIDARRKREEEIEEAAYELLNNQGYSGISMLKIAKKAKASNETLYRWYGNKLGLFKALVRKNAEQVKLVLESKLEKKTGAQKTLQLFGPLLLELLVGEKAIALNRAAANDTSGELGDIITKEGRESVLPLLIDVISKAQDEGAFQAATAERVTDVYIRILIGDLQIRRVIGALDNLTKSSLKKRSNETLEMLENLYGEFPK